MKPRNYYVKYNEQDGEWEILGANGKIASYARYDDAVARAKERAFDHLATLDITNKEGKVTVLHYEPR